MVYVYVYMKYRFKIFDLSSDQGGKRSFCRVLVRCQGFEDGHVDVDGDVDV